MKIRPIGILLVFCCVLIPSFAQVLLRVGFDAKEPKLLKKVEIEYPEETKIHGLEGPVIVKILINRRGPLVAFVTFYRGQVKAFETPPLLVNESLNNRLKTIPLKFSLSLRNPAADEYNCQVTVTNPADQKAAFWQAPVVLIP
jgi:hypothetical protein